MNSTNRPWMTISGVIVAVEVLVVIVMLWNLG